MRVSPGLMTFMVGLLILAVVGIIYQQHLASSGAYGTASSATVEASNVKYMCPMRCVETDEPGNCPVCGMEMVAVKLATAPATTDAKALYTCPMHPQIEQDHPGTCPICGMELVLKEVDTSTVDPETQQMVAVVKLSPLQAVLADVQGVSPVQENVTVTIHAIGEVSLPEDRVNSIVSWQAGRVDNLLLREAGGILQSGTHILDIYSEELVQVQEEYLLALDAVNQLGNSGYQSIASSSRRLKEAAEQKLGRLGLGTEQISQLAASGKVLDHVEIFATHGGVVMEKFVTEGMYVREGERLFTVADLSTVWVDVEVFEQDAAQLAIGQRVSLLCPIHPGMRFTGSVELIEPSLDPRTRTHIARVVVNNREGILRPGMVMNTELTVSFGRKLLLPRNAVLHTGEGDLVYVLIGENQWQPRNVTVGHDFGDRVEIAAGLAEDEVVAGTAVFLLDSEAQLKGVPRPLDVPQAMEMDSAGGAGHAGHQR